MISRLVISIVILIFFVSCIKDEEDTDTSKEFIKYIEKPPRCSDVQTSYSFLSNKLYEFETPKGLIKYFDTIIQNEKECECYQENLTGFYMRIFPDDSAKGTIRIIPIQNLLIGDYYGYTGFFVHQKHVFVFIDKNNIFNLKKKNLLEYTTIKPKPLFPNFGDSESLWIFSYKDDVVKLEAKINCAKSTY